MNTTNRLARTSLLVTFILIGIGGFTRGSGSGYGCSDRWPLCEDGLLGGLLPRGEYHMLIEWLHRWVAAIVGILILLTAISIRKNLRNNLVAMRLSIAAVVAVAVQAMIGRGVVKADLDSDLVAIHLAISMVVIALLTVIVILVSTNRNENLKATDHRDWSRLLAFGAFGSYALLLLGAYVHNRYFSGWPLVNNQLKPDISDHYTFVHYLHRFAAGIGIIYIAYLVSSAKKRQRPKNEKLMIYFAAVAYGINVLLGAVHVFTEVSSSAVVTAHLLGACAVWVLLIASTTMSRFDITLSKN
ncbi:MAG TPA: COX15/CtaA family protein [Acidimicrobiales bacterium]|nr:COX15/CtaA family protein [Acidimicrobiales bacterium]